MCLNLYLHVHRRPRTFSEDSVDDLIEELDEVMAEEHTPKRYDVTCDAKKCARTRTCRRSIMLQ